MKKEEVRLRLQRVLEGSRNVEHLNRVFNWMRSRSHGLRSVKEVGDFAAHQDRRDQGISWKRAKDIFFNARLFLTAAPSRANPSGKGSISRDDWQAALLASLDLIGPTRVKRDLGISSEKARKLLLSAMERSKNLQPISTWPANEMRVVNYLQSRFYPSPVFDQGELLRELSQALLKEGLLDRSDLPRLEAQMGFISMYVVSIMHLCELDLGNAGTITLRAAKGPTGEIQIAATMQNVINQVELAAPLFKTSCTTEEWCNPACELPDMEIFTWQEPIELDELGRLAEMT